MLKHSFAGMTHKYQNNLSKNLLIFVFIKSSLSKPQCESHSADFPSFEHQDSRIIKGFETKRPLPYQLAIVWTRFSVYEDDFVEEGHICGGTLVTLEYGISALHCFDDSKNKDKREYFDLIIVIAGRYKRNIDPPPLTEQVRITLT